MKGKLKIVFLLILMFPMMISAAEVKLVCPSSTKNGSEIKCSIKITSTEEVAGFQADVSTSSGLVYKNYSKASGWAGSSSSSKFLIYDNKVSGSSKELGTYTYKVNTTSKDDLKVTLSKISVSNVNGGAISVNTSANATIRIMSSDNTLKDLTINGTTISGFNKDTLSYKYETTANSIKIGATKNNSYASVSGTGTKTVNYGSNTFNVVVKAEDGTSKTYKIVVTRPDNRDTVNTLNSLEVSGYKISPTFSKNTLNYTLTVEANVSKVTIKASRTSDKSSFSSGYGPREVSLSYGENKVYVKVKSENEKLNTYTVTITRKDNRSSNNNLKSLSVSSGNLVFNKDKTEYELGTDKREFTVTAEVEDSKAKVEGNKTYTLKDGENEIKIVVTAENTKTKTYILKVTRTDDLSKFIISNKLKDISINKKYSIDFQNEITEYNVKIGDETKLEIDFVKEDEKANVEILGNENLQDGSIITIKVTSSDGKVNEYKINIEKESLKQIQPEKEKNNLILYIAIGISVLLNIMLVIVLLKKKNDNK